MLGKQLLHYQIEGHLGTGGMGEVYRALDTKLGRAVAIKVLPELFAQDVERVARFEREARLLASLNHANIAALHGLETWEGRRFLVMELVEGETLGQRIHAGRLAPEEALAIARQICEALEAAHEKGVVHRDLKPANIKITPDGKVKVLDFGLAKAVEEGAKTNLVNSPTLSIAATHAGIILGTAAYMSPEQAKGVATDQRSDIFSFGCVLFEMLTGRQSFQGDTMTEVIASVLKTEPDVTLLPPNLHPRLVEVITRCLAKDPKRRWHAIADVRVEIESILADPHGLRVKADTRADARPLWRRVAPAAVAALLAASVTGAAAWMLRPRPDTSVARFTITLPEAQRLTRIGRHNIAISPDGKSIVYVADQQLYLRGIGDVEPRPIQGTNQDVNSPFFSPDGQWIGFYAVGEGRLKKIAITGGVSVPIADIPNPHGVTWASGARILIGAGEQGIARVSADGGTPETIIEVEPGQLAYGPQMLPDGDHVLFTLAASTGANRWSEARILVQSLSTGQRTEVWRGGSDARYVPTGHIVYALDSDVLALPFDVRTLRATAGPASILEHVMRATAINTGAAFMAFSDNGTLVHFVGDSLGTALRTLSVVDRKGMATPLPFAAAAFFDPRVSPDGRQLVVRVDDESAEGNLWIYDMAGPLQPRKLTFGGINISPLWTPDRRIIFLSLPDGGQPGIFSLPVEGGSAEPLMTTEPIQPLGDLFLSHDGSSLLFRNGTDGGDIWIVPMTGDRKPRPLIEGPSNFQTSFSRDGRWIAYTTAEGGSPRVHVQPFPPTGRKELVATVDARAPLWSPDGKQLFYLENLPGLVSRLTAVDIDTENGFRVVGKPQPIFDGVDRGAGPWPYAILDDDRFVVVLRADDATSSASAVEIRVTLNWFEDLKQRVPLD